MEVFSKQELLEIHDKLNRYEWDYRLGSKPQRFDRLPNHDRHTYLTKYNILKPYMKLLGSLLTEKEVLKFHHVNNLNKSEREFNRWWLKRQIRIIVTGDPF